MAETDGARHSHFLRDLLSYTNIVVANRKICCPGNIVKIYLIFQYIWIQKSSWKALLLYASQGKISKRRRG